MRARLTGLFGLIVFTFVFGVSNAAAQTMTQTVASICKDGSSSVAKGRGACSGHGGVDGKATETARKAQRKAAEDARKAERKVDKAENKAEKRTDKREAVAAGATAQCKDGTYSHAANHRGACSRHGGVAKFLK